MVVTFDYSLEHNPRILEVQGDQHTSSYQSPKSRICPGPKFIIIICGDETLDLVLRTIYTNMLASDRTSGTEKSSKVNCTHISPLSAVVFSFSRLIPSPSARVPRTPRSLQDGCPPAILQCVVNSVLTASIPRESPYQTSIMPVVELPRLTGTLRAFAGLSAPSVENGNRSAELAKNLEWKRRQRSERNFGSTVTWSQFKELVLDGCSDNTSQKEVSLADY